MDTTYKYSPSTGCFYPSDIGYTDIPSDAIAATAAQFQAALARGPGDTLSVVSGAVTVVPYAGPTVAEAQASQVQALTAAYQAEIATPVSYTSKAGVTKTYQADSASVSNLQNTLLGLQATQATPTGFYWVASDNTQVPFTYADLQALAAAMLAQGWDAFQKLQALKIEVAAGATVAAVQAVAWPA